MEVIFPTTDGFRGMFFVGVRKNGAGVTERTGTVMLKRTYGINPATGQLSPATDPFPIFMQDQPHNVVLNGDFEISQKDFGEQPENEHKPGRWIDTANVSLLVETPSVNGNALQVSGPVSSRLTQTIAFEKPLAGRTFAFSFSASVNVVPTDIQGAQLEADGASPICVLNGAVSNAGFNRFSAIGTWQAALQAKEMRVVLPVASNPARVVYYDEVQVEERGFVSRWDPNTTLRYEHDLFAFKPQGDVIVLGFTDIAGASRIRVDGVVWLERVIPTTREKALFGWEPRVGGPRKGEMSTFSDKATDYPLADPLPAAFQNKFYNGYNRTAAKVNPVPYIGSSAQISIERNGVASYQFAVTNERVTAILYRYIGSGPDEEALWNSDAVQMNMDTLVVEPDENRCYVIWRGVWSFDSYPEDLYRRLIVSSSQ